jgi:hypothetical protein
MKDNYTSEQKKYIKYKEKCNTKLLACAGSGKTRCIIARMDRLIKKHIYSCENIMMLTFTRFTKDDFISKIESYGAKHININCIKTIDSFAKSLIDSDNKIDVSLLSLRFMNYLENTSKEDLLKIEKLVTIRTIFVDESQDLNEIQYNIFLLLNSKLDITINLIGDPNQNIYQFRGSSDKYLTNFEGKVFKLTKNFRSYQPIIDFCKNLQTYTDIDITGHFGDNDCKPLMLFYKNEQTLESRIIGILQDAILNEIDLKDIAILSPTRGRMGNRSHGLCLVSNILHQNKIPFKQFYEESSEEITSGQIKYQPETGYINILTYMGSKGLEWKYVIIIDADLCLINKRFLDKEKHLNDKYLLYVACSRAIEHMVIITRYHTSYNTIKFKTNPWFSEIPNDKYTIEDDFYYDFAFPKVEHVNMGNSENNITKIINRINEYQLDKIVNLSNYETKKEIKYKKIYNTCYESTSNSMFLGKYIEKLFHIYCDIKYNRIRKEIIEIKNINKKNVVIGNIPNSIILWFNNKKSNALYTWQSFDNDKVCEPYIKKFINDRFDRNKEFLDHILFHNTYLQNAILQNCIWIQDIYNKYMKCTNYKKSIKLVFYITVILHALDTHHYFHIGNRGSKFAHILVDYKKLFGELKTFVVNMKYNFIESNKIIAKYGFIGEIDIIDNENNIWEIKCSSELTLCNFIQVLIYNIMDNEILNEVKYTIRFINLLRGEIIHYSIKLNRDNINEIINILNKVGEIQNL